MTMPDESMPVAVELTGTPRMLSDGEMPTAFLLDGRGNRWHEYDLCGVSFSVEGALLSLHRECERFLLGAELEAAREAMKPHMTPEILHRWDDDEEDEDA